MLVKVEIPEGSFCRVWGKIHCIFNEDVTTGDHHSICRYLQALCDKDSDGQSIKRADCPSLEQQKEVAHSSPT